MKKPYPNSPLHVKPRESRPGYPFLRGFRNFMLNAVPFALIWLAAGVNTLAAALAAFLMMLFYCLRENYLRNRRLSEMARKLKEQGNA